MVEACPRFSASAIFASSFSAARAWNLGTFTLSKRNATPSSGWNRSGCRNHAAFAVRTCVIYSPRLKNAGQSLSSPGMSTLASNPAVAANAVGVECTEDELIVTLADDHRVSAPLVWFPRLLEAAAAQRADWRLIGGGIGIHWEAIDEDISIRSLLAS